MTKRLPLTHKHFESSQLFVYNIWYNVKNVILGPIIYFTNNISGRFKRDYDDVDHLLSFGQKKKL